MGKPRSHSYCCVPNCLAKSADDPMLSFHRFPEDRNRRVQWCSVLNITSDNIQSKKVCARHFESVDFLISSKKKILKSTSVPKPFIEQKPNVSVVEIRKETKDAHTQTEHFASTEDAHTQTIKLETHSETKTFSDEAIQVETWWSSLEDFIKTDTSLNILTGLNSLLLLNFLEDLMKKNKPCLHRRLTVKQRIVMTFMKLKLDLTYCALGVLFGGVAGSTIKRQFIETVGILKSILRDYIHSSSEDEILQNIPVVSSNFQNIPAKTLENIYKRLSQPTEAGTEMETETESSAFMTEIMIKTEFMDSDASSN